MTTDNNTTEVFGEYLKNFKEYSGYLTASELHQAAEFKRFSENYRRLAELNKREAEKQQEQQRRIAEVTSMELPLNYNNSYSADERAAGVYAESIPDGLILSLNELGCVVLCNHSKGNKTNETKTKTNY